MIVSAWGGASSGYFLDCWLIVFVVGIVALFGTSQPVSSSVYVRRATQLRVRVYAFAYCACVRVCDNGASVVCNTTNMSTAAPFDLLPLPFCVALTTLFPFSSYFLSTPLSRIVIVSARGLHPAVGLLLGLLLAGVLLQTKQYVSDSALYIIPRLLYLSTECAQ